MVDSFGFKTLGENVDFLFIRVKLKLLHLERIHLVVIVSPILNLMLKLIDFHELTFSG